MEEKNPIVFISYSQDSMAFADRVLEFSNKLRSEGIDTILDQYEESPAEGWPRWMDRNIDKADYVLVIGSNGYYQKVMGNAEQGTGKGVLWEGNIIYQKLYNSSSINTKFIPVIFEKGDEKYIPTPLQGSTYYNVSVENEYDRLYWRLRGVTSKKKPELGKLRPLPSKERKTLFFTSMIDVPTWDKAKWKGAGFMIGYLPLPTLMLPFTNESAARKIFQDWIKNIGNVDKDDDIRIALVEGDIPGEPAGYFILIGTNLDEAIKRANNSGLKNDELMIMNVQRFIRANPTDNFAAYNTFRKFYESQGEYYLIPAIYDQKRGIMPIPELRIRKKALIYRNLVDIKEGDEDSILLTYKGEK